MDVTYWETGSSIAALAREQAGFQLTAFSRAKSDKEQLLRGAHERKAHFKSSSFCIVSKPIKWFVLPRRCQL